MDNKKRGFFRKTLVPIALSAFLLGGTPLIAQETNPSNNLEQTLEQDTPNDKKKPESSLEMNLNFGIGIKKESIDSLYSRNRYSIDSDSLWRSDNIPYLTLSEETQVESLIKNIKTGTINSYSNLIGDSKNLSENQKLVLLSAIGNLLGFGSYDDFGPEHGVFSQDIFFEKLQNYLQTGDKSLLGICGHIATHIERLSNDFGIPAAAVTGISGDEGHVYDILKIDGGTSIINYGDLFITNTKNIETTLQAYQKHLGRATFQHLFFNNAKFMYKLIPKDGKHLIEFLDYETTPNKLKNSLTQKNNFKQSDLIIDLDFKDYIISGAFNYFGFFIKGGQIKGDSSSPLKNLNLFQFGLRKNFSLKKININSDLSFILGDIDQDKNLEDRSVQGIEGNFIISTKREKGFNFSYGTAGSLIGNLKQKLGYFVDLHTEAGISYKIPFEKVDLKPYIITQFFLPITDLGTSRYSPHFSELIAGTILDFKTKIPLSIDLYYLNRPWENGFGGNMNFGNDNFNIDIGGYMARSGYEFCPHKWGLNFGGEFNLRDIFSMGINYQLDETNYDGEKDFKSEIKVYAKFMN